MTNDKQHSFKEKQLPIELDNSGVIFSYGSLLEHEKLRELFSARGKFEIFETGDKAEAVKLIKTNPNDIVILKNAQLENVRVSIVTEQILRRWYESRGGSIRELVDAGISGAEIMRALFLYARLAHKHEKGRSLHGGLICNLRSEELLILDNYEWKPILERTPVTKIKIGNRRFSPKYITFYAGTESADDINLEEKAKRAELLNLNRSCGCLSPQAKWRRNVRRG